MCSRDSGFYGYTITQIFLIFTENVTYLSCLVLDLFDGKYSCSVSSCSESTSIENKKNNDDNKKTLLTYLLSAKNFQQYILISYFNSQTKSVTCGNYL